MKVVYKSIILCFACSLFLSVGAIAQDENPSKTPEKIAKIDKVSDPKDIKTNASGEIDTQDDKPDSKKEASKEGDDGKKVSTYYKNYLEEYLLGPKDIISVEVFGQCPDYCKLNITVPPTARISYPLVRDGILVGGRTVEQVAADVTKQLNEYIIDPKVTVTLLRAGSAHYAVMGKVGVPGVRIMDRRISVNEAILGAGGLAKGANKKKVYIARFNRQGFMERRRVDLIGIERGKVQTIFLRPGDQIFVGSKGFTWSKVLGVIERASAARILFGSPF